MPSAPKKTAQTIIDSGNDYLGALKGNQSGLLSAVQVNFQAQQTMGQLNKGHGRIEKRTISISHDLSAIPDFPGLRTLIRVVSERQVYRAFIIRIFDGDTLLRLFLNGACPSLSRPYSRILGGRE
jgi:hypothetical protein